MSCTTETKFVGRSWRSRTNATHNVTHTIAAGAHVALLHRVRGDLAREQPIHVGDVGRKIVRMGDPLEACLHEVLAGIASDLTDRGGGVTYRIRQHGRHPRHTS